MKPGGEEGEGKNKGFTGNGGKMRGVRRRLCQGYKFTFPSLLHFACSGEARQSIFKLSEKGKRRRRREDG